MRLDITNTRAMSLRPNSGSTSMRAVVAQGARGEQGLPGNASAAWTASTAVTTGTVRQAPDGSWIKSTASRTTRATFDATEQGWWTATLATAGTLEADALSVAIGDTVSGDLADTDTDIGQALNDVLADFTPVDTGAVADAVAEYAVSPSLPREPSLLGWVSDNRLVDSGSSAVVLSTSGRYAIVSRRTAGVLTVVDLIDPTAPVVVSTLTDGTNLPSPNRMAVTGNYVIVSCHQRVTVVDISNPAAPTVTGSVSNTNLSDSGATNGIALSADGNTAFVTQSAGNRINAVDITTKASPSYTSGLNDNTNLASPRNLVVLSPTRVAVIAGTTDAVVIINTSNLASLSIAASLVDGTNLDNGSHMVRRGTVLYVVTGGGRVTTVSVATVDTPVVIGSLNNASYISGVGRIALLSTMLVLTTSLGGLVFVDVSDPANPTLTSGLRTTAGIGVFGFTSAFIATGGNLLVHVARDLGRLTVFGASGLAPGGAARRQMSSAGHSMERMNGNSGTTIASASSKATKGPHTWANMIDGQRWVLAHNGGSDGETSADILARLYTATSLYRSPLVELWMNTNDMGNGITAAQSIANTRQAVELLRARGCRVILSNIAARTFSSDPGGLLRTAMNTINAGLAEIAETTEGVWLNDYFTATNSGDGTPTTGLTYDGLHQTSTGAQLLGAVLKATRDQAAAGLYLANPQPLSATNLAPNATLSGTGGTVGTGASGTVADSATVTNAVASKPTSSVQRLVVGASVTATFVETATVTAGDVLVAEVTLDAATFNKVTRFNLKLTAGANVAYDLSPVVAAGLSGVGGDDTTTNPIPTLGTGITLRTYPIPVPTGTTSADITLTITTGSGGSTGNIDIKSVALRSTLVGA